MKKPSVHQIDNMTSEEKIKPFIYEMLLSDGVRKEVFNVFLLYYGYLFYCVQGSENWFFEGHEIKSYDYDDFSDVVDVTMYYIEKEEN